MLIGDAFLVGIMALLLMSAAYKLGLEIGKRENDSGL